MKELPDTATADFWTRLLLPSVTQGMTEVTLTPLRLKVWLVVEPLLLMATKTMVWGEEVLVFLKALTATPDVGAAVAPMR